VSRYFAHPQQTSGIVSYATAGNAARYQEMEVLAASPAQLVVVVFDHLLVMLRRARIAMEQGNVELRVDALGRARDAVAELLVTLDHEKGGSVASQLSGLYTFFLSELVDVGRRNDVSRLDRIAGMVQELRDAFAQIAGSPRGAAA
jgi:flagellar protein FliS